METKVEVLEGDRAKVTVTVDEKTIADFIDTLEVSESVKAEMRAISPWTYTGI